MHAPSTKAYNQLFSQRQAFSLSTAMELRLAFVYILHIHEDN
jgi:hypothetical protein